MKVMTAMYTLRRGGAYDRFLMMLEAFLERNYETHCLSLTPIPINHSYFHNHVMYLPLKKVHGLIAKLAVVFLFPLWSFWIAWRKKIDLIIAFGSLYAFLQGFSKWILKRPMVTFIRGSSYFGLTTQNSPRYLLHLNKIFEYVGLLISDQIITNNIAARDEMLKSLGKRRNIDVQILYNNIPTMNIIESEDISKTREKYGIPGDAKVLVTAGILNRGKNIETLISCLSKLEVENVYVLIVGDGSTKVDFRYKDYLKKLAEKLGVSEKVIFTGWLEKKDLWEIYLASNLFVLPSLNEGMPNAMLEALGAGLPCIGSNIVGIKDILQYDELLFDPQDERNLVAKIQQVILDNQFLNRVKRSCQERKEVFLFDWKEKVFQMATMGFNNVHDRL
jgi:glycosyltransferase involved in cell wall biosynthesis